MGPPISLDPEDFPKKPLFTAGPEPFEALDVILAADLRGELSMALDELRQGIAALETLEDEDEVSQDALQSAVDAWRAGRDLESAEETDAWLAARELEVDHVVSFSERALAAERAPEAPADEVDEAEISSELYAHLVCKGELERQAVELARRAAAHAAWVEGGKTSPTPEEVAAHRAKTPHTPTIVPGPRSDLLATIESVFELKVAASLEPERIARAVENARLDLLQLDVTSAAFATQDAAREAVFCIEEDQDELARVAGRAGAPVARRVDFASELEEKLRSTLLSTRVGRLVGPFEQGGRFVLYKLEKKIEPTPADPEVRARISRRLRDRAFRDEMEARVRWIIWQPSKG
jgi:hypothetical protein